MSMYRSVESTQNYRPLLYRKDNSNFWWIIYLMLMAAVAIWYINTNVLTEKPVENSSVTFKEEAVKLRVENRYLKGQVSNLYGTLLELTNKFNYVYQLYQNGSSNQLVTLSNMITLTEENGALRVENALLLKKLQPK